MWAIHKDPSYLFNFIINENNVFRIDGENAYIRALTMNPMIAPISKAFAVLGFSFFHIKNKIIPAIGTKYPRIPQPIPP